MLPDGVNWLCYFAGNSKSHRENSFSFIFLEFPHQLDMKNVVKSSKHFFGVFQYSRNSQWLSILTLFTLGWKVEGSDFVYSFWRWVHIGKKNFWDEAAFNYLQGLIHVLNSWLLLGLLLGLTYSSKFISAYLNLIKVSTFAVQLHLILCTIDSITTTTLNSRDSFVKWFC